MKNSSNILWGVEYSFRHKFGTKSNVYIVETQEAKVYQITIPVSNSSAHLPNISIQEFDRSADSYCSFLVFQKKKEIGKSTFSFSEYINNMSFSAKGQSLRLEYSTSNNTIISASVIKNGKVSCTFNIDEAQEMRNIHPVVFSFPELELLPSTIVCKYGRYELKRIIKDREELMTLINPIDNSDYRVFDPEQEYPSKYMHFFKWSTKAMQKIMSLFPGRK